MIILIGLMNGCTTPEERAARAQDEIEEMIKIYSPACEKLGYKTDTDPWRDCILQLSTREDLRRANTSPMMTQCFGHRGFIQCMHF